MSAYSPDDVIVFVPEPLVTERLRIEVVYFKARVMHMEFGT